MTPKIVKTSVVGSFGAAAITIFPFIFISPAITDQTEYDAIIKHEMVHWYQQLSWAKYTLGLGLLAWFFCYEFVLPVGWNPFRYKWEAAAYKVGQGCSDEEIQKIMKQAPYYLWWT